MPIVLYDTPGSPFCMGIMVLAKHIGLDIQTVSVNLEENEHNAPAYLQMNPFHNVPTLNDNGFVLFESRAIMRYLVDKYANGSALYPKDPEKRALVDAMLDTDCGNLGVYEGLRTTSLMTSGQDLPDAFLCRLTDHYKCLNNLLAKRKYAAGDQLTLADIGLIHSIAYGEAHGDDISSYEHLKGYRKKIREELGAAFTAYEDQLVKLNEFVKSIKK